MSDRHDQSGTDRHLEDLASYAKNRPTDLCAPRPRWLISAPQRPEDVRGDDASSSLSPRTFAYSFPDLDVGLEVKPPLGRGLWNIKGKVYVASPEDQTVSVFLIEDDHVLASSGVADGGDFSMEEPASFDWHLEFHLPSGSAMRVDCPFQP